MWDFIYGYLSGFVSSVAADWFYDRVKRWRNKGKHFKTSYSEKDGLQFEGATNNTGEIARIMKLFSKQVTHEAKIDERNQTETTKAGIGVKDKTETPIEEMKEKPTDTGRPDIFGGKRGNHE